MFNPELHFDSGLDNLVDDFNIFANTVYSDILRYDIDFCDAILVDKLFTKDSIQAFYRFVISEFQYIGIDEIKKSYPDNISAQIQWINELSNYMIELDKLLNFILSKIND